MPGCCDDGCNGGGTCASDGTRAPAPTVLAPADVSACTHAAEHMAVLYVLRTRSTQLNPTQLNSTRFEHAQIGRARKRTPTKEGMPRDHLCAWRRTSVRTLSNDARRGRRGACRCEGRAHQCDTHRHKHARPYGMSACLQARCRMHRPMRGVDARADTNSRAHGCTRPHAPVKRSDARRPTCC